MSRWDRDAHRRAWRSIAPGQALIDMTRRFWIGLALALPVIALEMGGQLVSLPFWPSGETANWLQRRRADRRRCAVPRVRSASVAGHRRRGHGARFATGPICVECPTMPRRSSFANPAGAKFGHFCPACSTKCQTPFASGAAKNLRTLCTSVKVLGNFRREFGAGEALKTELIESQFPRNYKHFVLTAGHMCWTGCWSFPACIKTVLLRRDLRNVL
jgi:hypothetical protein